MNTETVVMCIVALVLGMLMANMLKNVCGCKTVEGLDDSSLDIGDEVYWEGDDYVPCTRQVGDICGGPMVSKPTPKPCCSDSGLTCKATSIGSWGYVAECKKKSGKD